MVLGVIIMKIIDLSFGLWSYFLAKQAEKLKSREIKSWWWMSDGSLDGDGVSDGGMNVCVCDVVYDVVYDVESDIVHDVVCNVVDDVVCDVVKWNDWF